jgi:hypothetical protein
MDHGAQFFTVRSERFRGLVDAWIKAGVADEWARGFADAQGIWSGDGYPRYRGIPGMTGIPKYLAHGLDIQLSHKVTCISWEDDRWLVHSEDDSRPLAAHHLISTAPVPQALDLLGAGGIIPREPARTALEMLTYHPCLAILAVLDGPSGIPAPGGVQINGEPIIWLADNTQKGISDRPTLTIHASPQFSARYWEDRETGAEILLEEVSENWLTANVVESQVHGWKFAQPTQNYPQRYLFLNEPGPLVFAGDAFGEARVEGAALSGLAAAEALFAR